MHDPFWTAIDKIFLNWAKNPFHTTKINVRKKKGQNQKQKMSDLGGGGFKLLEYQTDVRVCRFDIKSRSILIGAPLIWESKICS